MGQTAAGSGNQLVIDGLSLAQPVHLEVVSVNDFGTSQATVAPAVGGVRWAPSVRVNDVAGSAISSAPSVALGPDGAGSAVWPDSRGTSMDIYFSRRDPASGAWSANAKVNNDTGTARQSGPAIAVDGSGNAYSVWEDQRNGATNSGIYFSKRPSGGAWGANAKVNDDTQTAIQSAPSIGTTSSGAATAVWLDNRKNKKNISSSSLPAGGSAWAANLKVTGNETSNKATPDLAVGADGTAYAVWADDRSANNDIYFAKLLPGGSAWSANVKVSDDPGTARQERPSVAVDSAGNVLVVWDDYRAGNYSTGLAEVRASGLPAGSSTWSASVVVADATSKPAKTDLAIRPDGRAFGVWADAASGQYEIRSAERDPSSGSWTAPVAVSDISGSDLDPQVAYSASQVLLVYRNSSDVYARRSTN